MAINGIRGPYDSYRPTGPSGARPQDATGAARTAGAKTAAAPSAAPAPANSGVPVSAPPGTDPELWNVLTNDERVYFAKLGAMGPLTYGRVLTGQPLPTPPAARGVRLDVKA